MTVECSRCGTQVSLAWARVFGDEDANVERCYGCDSAVRLQQGSAAGVDVPHPDPAEIPGRRAGGRL